MKGAKKCQFPNCECFYFTFNFNAFFFVAKYSSGFPLSVMVFELNLIAFKLVEEEGLVDMHPT